ncbi:alpha/beta-hydrolase [Trametes polyzona]|nr:alpha/beta-hydrolase [Trametes polyzona]
MSLDGPLTILEDSGIPRGSTDYTTVVILHGYSYHSGTFTKVVPLGRSHNARVILVNRRDYPGSVPYTRDELALLDPYTQGDPDDDGTTTSPASENVRDYMKARALEICQFLEGLVRSGDVPLADRERGVGGIVIAGWSMGTGWMTALLAHAPSFSSGDFELADYVLRVVFLDPPYRLLGYPSAEGGLYDPLFEDDIPLEERESVFAHWVSGYFEHGSTPETLSLKTPLEHPSPTLSRLTPEEVASVLCHPPGEPDGSDALVLHRGIEVGLWRSLRLAALADRGRDGWGRVEVRAVTCERSICDCLWARMCLLKEVEDARAKGLPVRDVHFVLIKGANHFVQWDQPEYLLRALW